MVSKRVRGNLSRRAGRGLATVAVASMAGFGVWSAPALAVSEACPNATLRAEDNSTRLPECRAYELVTPPYKEGFSAGTLSFTDDGAYGYRSTGNFANNGMGTALGNQYLATRSTTGWNTTALAPSGPTYISNGLAEATSSDLRSSIWLMRRSQDPADVADLYLRGADGAFTRIGPSANPATLPAEPAGNVYDGPAFAALVVVGASANLSHVLIALTSQLGYPGDTSAGVSSLYEYTGTGNERPALVGVDNNGHQLSGGNTCASDISTDGRVVFFDPGCLGGTSQVWARINGTTSIQASASQCDRGAGDAGGLCNAPGSVNFAGAASNGSRVFFTTTEQLVNEDIDQSNDLYECDIPPGTPAPVGTANPCPSLSEVTGGTIGAGFENVVRASEDGTRVYFVAQAVLAGNPGTNDAAAVAGENNLYVWEKDAAHPTGQTTFVAKLGVNDLETGQVSHAQTTAEGRYLVFNTANQLLASDTDEGQDVYRYDADTGTLLRLSTGTSGSGGNTPGLNAELGGSIPNRVRSSITADGSTVVFMTSEALSPADTNGAVDVYAWHEGQVSLISSGRPSLPLPGIPFAAISASGTDIYFDTTAQLTPNDVDTIEDVYDARVGGGFGFPELRACSGEGCQAIPAPQPQALGAPASATFTGTGNLATPPPNAPAAERKSMTRAQKLAKALKACKAKHDKKKRSACEKHARRTYGSSR